MFDLVQGAVIPSILGDRHVGAECGEVSLGLSS
jgi:hypothetical protein